MDPWQIVVVLATALGTTWAAFIAAFFKGDLIPGHVYRREVKRGDALQATVARTAQAIERTRREQTEEPDASSG